MDRPLNLTKAFGCCTIDTVTEFAFAKCFNDLDDPDFHSEMSNVLTQLLGQVHAITHLPWMLIMMNSLPVPLQEIVQPGLIVVNKYHDVNNQAHLKFSPVANIQKMIKEQVRLVKKSKERGADPPSHTTIFNEILDSKLPPEELTVKRLGEEANIIIGAGSDTVKHALAVATFYVLDNTHIHQKLRAELLEAMPEWDSTLTLPELEALPYLNAVIQEGKVDIPLLNSCLLTMTAALRLSYGVSQRSPRISPHETIKYKEYVIPPKYAISMDAVRTCTTTRVSSRTVTPSNPSAGWGPLRNTNDFQNT